MGWGISPLRFNQQPDRSKSSLHNISHGGVVGLRILTHRPSNGGGGRHSSNILLISALNYKKNKSQLPSSCFLRSCSLCSKALKLDREVYMYRGNQGFCSVECRSRKMYIDERKEMEISIKNRLATFRQPHDTYRRCDTSALLEEYRHRSMSSPSCPNRRAIFTLS